LPTIFDNITSRLLPELQRTLEASHRADFCVGYFNLRGWALLHSQIDRWSAEDGPCRLLVGMPTSSQDDIRRAYAIVEDPDGIDNQTIAVRRRKLAEDFRDQLTIGVPTAQDEYALRRLAAQIKAGKVVVKLFLAYPLHAKLYLLFPHDTSRPTVGYAGSSNLTLAGLSRQAELNLQLTDDETCRQLVRWFEDRWNDHWCIDISNDLIEIINDSWAREVPVDPYLIYLKMAYHVAQEAISGLSEFNIPPPFDKELFEFQKAAVKIAAHHLNKRNGALLGDVVGLGKTIMATALARIVELDQGLETLIICPANLVKMWQDYRLTYGLRGTVLSVGQVIDTLPTLPRHRLVLIDESHNLRNREGKRYAAISDYIDKNDSKVILLSATPYNKAYADISAQLRLFISDTDELPIRPEHYLRDIGEIEFRRRHQFPFRSLGAFEQSTHADDWRDLMRLYLVRRTRSFIQDNYAEVDPQTGRKFLSFGDGTRSYFPNRLPRTVKFQIDEADPSDQYARLYAQDVVDAINDLTLPRYGLGNYLLPAVTRHASTDEQKTTQDLSRAGKRLMGFCRTNLFKRLESSGKVFCESLQRHILRNYIYLYALENDLPIPVGTQDADLLDGDLSDPDVDLDVTIPSAPTLFSDVVIGNGAGNGNGTANGTASHNTIPNQLSPAPGTLRTPADFRLAASAVYKLYAANYRRRFKWLRPALLDTFSLRRDLAYDADALLGILSKSGDWHPARDAKLQALVDLITRRHPHDKVLVFTQFADTVNYLQRELSLLGIDHLAGATGDTSEPVSLARRFSPSRNGGLKPGETELRVLIATDVLSEGQNLQDAHIVVNYDLPWTIVRLVQRAGRVDRIGQSVPDVLCYTFLPADGVEEIIHLRERVRTRLHQAGEVLGTDEAFFEDDKVVTLHDLFNEKAGLLDDEPDHEVDLASRAYEIWKNALKENPSLEDAVKNLPNVVYSTRPHTPTRNEPEGVLVYLRTPQGNDALAWIDHNGRSITESQLAILNAAKCDPDTKPLERLPDHHKLVEEGVRYISQTERSPGGSLGRPGGARFRTYERLSSYAKEFRGLPLLVSSELEKAIQELYEFPLRQSATDILNRRLRAGITDEQLVELVLNLRNEDRFCIISQEQQAQEPRIICSLGLRKP
jgi:SNF2 family DNA or RNA helicase